MKREDWNVEFLNERIDNYISELPNRDGFIYKRKYKEFEAGDPKTEQNKGRDREYGKAACCS